MAILRDDLVSFDLSVLKTPAAGSSAPAGSPRFVPVSDLPEWTVWDQVNQCDLYPTKSGNRDYALRGSGEDTAHLIADALNAYTANAGGEGRL